MAQQFKPRENGGLNLINVQLKCKYMLIGTLVKPLLDGGYPAG